MIKYIGSKRVLIPYIDAIVSQLPGCRTVLDLFSGTSRVSHALKRRGFHVHANDLNAYAHMLATAYVQADGNKWRRKAERLIRELQDVPGEEGYVTKTFCKESRYFKPKNGRKIDAIRERIAEMGLKPELEAIVLVSLMEAADRVDSTTGLQMAYLKQWAPRASNDLELRLPNILDGPGIATRAEAESIVDEVKVDIAYLDPPYNQHSYLGNYHIWETLVLWDKPEVYGVACKRVDCRSRKSRFNFKREMPKVFEDIIERIQAKFIVVSFSNEGFLSREALEDMLGERGFIRCYPVDYKRYVGAQIGIFNPSGDKVGSVSHLRNKEYLFVVSPDVTVLEGLDEAFAQEQPAEQTLMW